MYPDKNQQTKHSVLSDTVNTFGQSLLKRYGERVHKLAINASFSCPNRDGSKGVGGCSFCNNSSFSPNAKQPPSIAQQIDAGRKVIKKRTGAQKFIAYFQAYSNTYAETSRLAQLYELALSEPDVIGLSIGTRPDCVNNDVLDLLASYRNRGFEVWLELGLQSAFDETLKKVNRGHGFKEYQQTLIAARERGIPVCTHLILGLPGENILHWFNSLDQVLELGVDGLKLHPLHVVKHTMLAKQWKRGEYQPLEQEDYVDAVSKLIYQTPKDIVFHRITGTASKDILLAPKWCSQKWRVLNAIHSRLLQNHNTRK